MAEDVGRFRVVISATGSMFPRVESSECHNLPSDAFCTIGFVFEAPEPPGMLAVGLTFLAFLAVRRRRSCVS